MRNLTVVSSVLLSVWSLLPGVASAQNYEKLKTELGDVNLAAGWIFEDIAAGYAAAKRTGKPLLVAFR